MNIYKLGGISSGSGSTSCDVAVLCLVYNCIVYSVYTPTAPRRLLISEELTIPSPQSALLLMPLLGIFHQMEF